MEFLLGMRRWMNVQGHVAAHLCVSNDRAKLIEVLAQLLPFILAQ